MPYGIGVSVQSLCANAQIFPEVLRAPRRVSRALIAGRCGPSRRSGRRRAAYRPMEWVASLCTQLPRTVILGNPVSDKRHSRKPGFRYKVLSESSGGKLLSLVLYRTLLTASAKYFRSCDKGAQPYAARGKAGNHITKVVHPKVHPAEADEEHQQRYPKDNCRPCPPGS